MKHNGGLTAAVFRDIIGVERSRSEEIDLNGATLLDSTHAVSQGIVYLGAIKSTFSRHQLPGKAGGFERLFQRLFRIVPQVVGSNAFLGTGRETKDHFVEAEIPVNSKQQLHKIGHFRLNLLLCTNDMAVVLHKTADTHQSVHASRWLVAVAGTKFSISKW